MEITEVNGVNEIRDLCFWYSDGGRGGRRRMNDVSSDKWVGE